ncbi:MAG: diguanylate cyclase [Lautropia sp.]
MIDTKTVAVVAAMTCALCAVLLWSMRRVHERSRRYMALAALGEALAACSLGLYALHGIAPDFVAVNLGNGVGLVVPLLYFETVRRIAGRPPRTAAVVLAGIALFAGQLALDPGPQSVGLRVAIASVVHLSFALAMLPIMIERRRLDPPIVMRWMIGFCVFYSASNALRLASTLFGGVGAGPSGPTGGNLTIQLFATLYSLVGVAWAMLLVALVNGRLALEYKRLARTDTLTGLANRRAFDERVGRLRDEASGAGALLMLDLDHFKRINDSYGHAGGDEVLRRFADLLRDALPVDGVAGRHGGEEFCVYLHDASPAESIAFAERICARTRALGAGGVGGVGGTLAGTALPAIPASQPGPTLSVSVGIAFAPQDGDAVSALMLAADRRVYLAKSRGRDNVVASDTRPQAEAQAQAPVGRAEQRIALVPV